jgi:hypothetical protein
MEVSTAVDLKDIYISYIDIRRLYEHNGVNQIVPGALEVEIINRHVFTLHPSRIYYVLHT